MKEKNASMTNQQLTKNQVVSDCMGIQEKKNIFLAEDKRVS